MPGKHTVPRQPSFMRECAQCSTPFKVWPSNDRRARVKFCSRACFHAAESMGREERTCEHCGATFTRPLRPSDTSVARRFCTHPCYLAFRADEARMADRFWAKVNKTATCWLWMGNTSHGYGQFWGHPNRRVAHRIAWELTNGPIPDGLFVLHNCPDGDNPLCVRPDHLFLGTQKDNMRDMVGKDRSARATVTVDQVRAIRARHASGESGVTALALEYGMTRSGMRHLLARRSWKYV